MAHVRSELYLASQRNFWRPFDVVAAGLRARRAFLHGAIAHIAPALSLSPFSQCRTRRELTRLWQSAADI